MLNNEPMISALKLTVLGLNVISTIHHCIFVSITLLGYILQSHSRKFGTEQLIIGQWITCFFYYSLCQKLDPLDPSWLLSHVVLTPPQEFLTLVLSLFNSWQSDLSNSCFIFLAASSCSNTHTFTERGSLPPPPLREFSRRWQLEV